MKNSTSSNRPPVPPNVRLVMDAVRKTGKTAFPPANDPAGVSDTVMLVAVAYNLNPVALQREVIDYGQACREATR